MQISLHAVVHSELFAFSGVHYSGSNTVASFTGADPENFHGRWLMGWLPIVNHTQSGAKGVAG